MEEDDALHPTFNAGNLQSDSQNRGEEAIAPSHDPSKHGPTENSHDNDSRQTEDCVQSERDTRSLADDTDKSGADNSVRSGEDNSFKSGAGADNSVKSEAYYSVRPDTDGTDSNTISKDITEDVNMHQDEHSKPKKKGKKKKKKRKKDVIVDPDININDQEELVEESKTKSQEIKGDDSFITPIDLEKKREEEQKIKMSWNQQLSINNKVSPSPDFPNTELAPMEYHPEKAVDINRFVPVNGASTYAPDRTQRRSEIVIGGDLETRSGDIGCCGSILMFLSFILVVATFPFSLFFCIKVVQEYERAVIFRLGRLLSGGSKGPGIFFVLPCIEGYTKVDLRTVSFDVPPQEILTSDSVTVSVDAVVYYRVCHPTISVANVENAHHATRLLAQTSLRNILGTKSMSEILTDREAISKAMQSMLDEATVHWGIKVERVEIKDVRLPKQLQKAMAAEAEASREARAKVLAAEGEHNASKALKEAADIINTSPAALQLRYLQTLNAIASEKNSTIVFPLPMDVLSTFLK
uniref:Band 7 protein AGAP004871-like isoform X4 n=1 Tax=Crassostrea virginica TaxID=6565 RepID=A0A8B8DNE3_CRAVI|nr:band 7 protein AGAP004871-like isoform X4 [Crassostrea virginica]